MAGLRAGRPNNKQIRINKIRNFKQDSLDHWKLVFGICLEFGICDSEFEDKNLFASCSWD
jgi:hypothetical protein